MRARGRLFAALDMQSRLTLWVAGPPGAGKKSLVASDLQAREVPCIWYQGDSGDADTFVFLFPRTGGAALA